MSGLDPNQIYSLRDQLRMDARAIEIDVHWAPSLEGDPAQLFRAPIMCHGEPIALGTGVVHAGCTIERHLRHGLAEVRAWLDEPSNQDEFVLLYLENVLDDDPAAHAAATAAIQQHLGDLVARPPAGQPCAPIPLTATRREMLDAGHRVLIVGNCGPGAWGTWVHERATGERWIEGSSGMGDDYPDYPACEARRANQGYGERLIRHWEDSTWLSTIAGAAGTVSATEARRMARCGVNLIGFDQLHPDDPRLDAVVWSWAPNEPTDRGSHCAYQGGDARFRSSGCGRGAALRLRSTPPAGTSPRPRARGRAAPRLRSRVPGQQSSRSRPTATATRSWRRRRVGGGCDRRLARLRRRRHRLAAHLTVVETACRSLLADQWLRLAKIGGRSVSTSVSSHRRLR